MPLLCYCDQCRLEARSDASLASWALLGVFVASMPLGINRILQKSHDAVIGPWKVSEQELATTEIPTTCLMFLAGLAQLASHPSKSNVGSWPSAPHGYVLSLFDNSQLASMFALGSAAPRHHCGMTKLAHLRPGFTGSPLWLLHVRGLPDFRRRAWRLRLRGEHALLCSRALGSHSDPITFTFGAATRCARMKGGVC